ncbi:DUF222 domain-containing protein [Plantibacter sp. YIM 135249]|uniref:HNH endonuclease signature motif containing protein n=1 Tax=Plantibacter sp. YIM 135249 TaxID=3423918 RepID=UPI003D34431F
MDIPSTPDANAARLTSLGEQIVAEDVCIAAAEARKATLFAETARLSDLTALTLAPPGTTPARAKYLARLSLHLELSAMTRVPERTIQHRIAESEVLVDQLPATLAALSGGSISVGHARVIVEQLADVDPADRAEFETRILPLAQTCTAAQLKQLARQLREKLHPETIGTRHHRARQDRHVTLSPAPDGMSWLSILTTATIATAAYNRLSDLTAATQRRGDPRTRARLMVDNAQSLLLYGVTASSGPAVAVAAPETTHSRVEDDEVPTWAARSAPARGAASMDDRATTPRQSMGGLARRTQPIQPTQPVQATEPVQMSGPVQVTESARTTVPVQTAGPLRSAGSVQGAGSSPGIEPHPITGLLPSIEDITDGIIPTVHVTVPVMTILGHEHQPGSLEGYGPIDPETAVRLSVQAKSFTRILTHPETGAVLSVSRERYVPPADMKRALAIRDTHCRAPGCNRLAKGCELDHTVPWSEGGETNVGNLAHLCPKHHHLKHDTNWSLEPGSDGALTWISPSGQVFSTEPDPPDWYPLEPLPEPDGDAHGP